MGDYAQLQSVDASGALSLLVHERADAPELIDVHRFVHEWEKAASLGLRQGNPESIDRYVAHDRVRNGITKAMADAAYEAWRADTRAGKATVLISDSNDAVTALNVRARTQLILEGRINAQREVALNDGTHASVGDTVITRWNDRRLRAARSWVRNGDRWTVIGVGRDGSAEGRRGVARPGVCEGRGVNTVVPRCQHRAISGFAAAPCTSEPNHWRLLPRLQGPVRCVARCHETLRRSRAETGRGKLLERDVDPRVGAG